MKIITTGQRYADIDALACVLAYHELESLEGQESEVVIPGPLNHSITETIRSWSLEYETQPTPRPQGEAEGYVVMDVSEPTHVATFVDPTKVLAIYDHHPGFKDFWVEKQVPTIAIEPLGACATLVWETFKMRGVADKISELSANLLATATLSNTLNFKASITDERDRAAYQELVAKSSLPEGWTQQYFQEQETSIFQDARTAVINDTKKALDIPNLGLILTIGQIELWDSRTFMNEHLDEVRAAMESFENENWFFTSPSISTGQNILYATNPKMKELLAKTIEAHFESDIGYSNRLWLRKEILEKLYQL